MKDIRHVRLVLSAVLAAASAVLLVAAIGGRATVLADAITCDLAQYKSAPGLTAAVEQDLLSVSWSGQGGAELRARYGIDDGQPVIRDLAIRKAGGPWITLRQNLTAEYRVTTGVRRMSEQQAEPLRAAGVELTPEVIAKNRWYAFWDAPQEDRSADHPGDRSWRVRHEALRDPVQPAGRVVGCDSPCGIRPATARSSSRCG